MTRNTTAVSSHGRPLGPRVNGFAWGLTVSDSLQHPQHGYCTVLRFISRIMIRANLRPRPYLPPPLQPHLAQIRAAISPLLNEVPPPLLPSPSSRLRLAPIADAEVFAIAVPLRATDPAIEAWLAGDLLTTLVPQVMAQVGEDVTRCLPPPVPRRRQAPVSCAQGCTDLSRLPA